MFKKLIMLIFVVSSLILFFFLGIYPFIKKEAVLVIPKIESMSEEEGLSILKSQKIKYEIIYVDGSENKIQRTVPEANSLIKEAQVITVYVERKVAEKIKDMTNMTLPDAKLVLEDYAKRYNIEYEVRMKKIDDGINNIVLDQNIYDTNLEEISKIIITVSECEYYITMPNFIGQNYKEAFDFCKTNGFIFEGIYINSLLDKDTIIYQETEEGKNLRKNSRNKLLFYIAK